MNKKNNLTSISHVEIHRSLGVLADVTDGNCLIRLSRVGQKGTMFKATLMDSNFNLETHVLAIYRGRYDL